MRQWRKVVRAFQPAALHTHLRGRRAAEAGQCRSQYAFIRVGGVHHPIKQLGLAEADFAADRHDGVMPRWRRDLLGDDRAPHRKAGRSAEAGERLTPADGCILDRSLLWLRPRFPTIMCRPSVIGTSWNGDPERVAP